MTDIELLPLPRWMETYRIPGDDFHTGPDQYLSDRMQAYARANLAPLQAENERLRAEVERLRRLVQERDTMLGKRLCAGTNADGKPRCLVLAEERALAERLAEALRRAHQWGGLGKGWDSGVALDLIAWIESGMEGELPPLPDYLAALAQEDRNG